MHPTPDQAFAPVVLVACQVPPLPRAAHQDHVVLPSPPEELCKTLEWPVSWGADGASVVVILCNCGHADQCRHRCPDWDSACSGHRVSATYAGLADPGWRIPHEPREVPCQAPDHVPRSTGHAQPHHHDHHLCCHVLVPTESYQYREEPTFTH